MSYNQHLNLTHLVSFANAMATAVCAQPNTRHNNMAMLRALNAKSMPIMVNQKKEAEASQAYMAVLAVITKAELTVIPDGEPEDITNLVLTYDRFKETLSVTKNYLLIVNS